jgi:hypothetical protein
MDALLVNPDAPLSTDVAVLQNLVRQLVGEVRRLREENTRLCQDNEQLRHRLDQVLRLNFGRRSERSCPRRARVPWAEGDEPKKTSRPRPPAAGRPGLCMTVMVVASFGEDGVRAGY